MINLILLILAALCIAYGVVVVSSGAGTMFFLVWEAMGVAFICAYIIRRLDLWQKIPSLVRIGVWSFIALCGVLLLVTVPLVISGFSGENIKEAKYVIILGAQVRDNGPSKTLRYRLDRAIEYMEEYPDSVCICSGGQGFNEPFAEAIGMKEYLLSKGISEERIIVEDKSLNTTENMKFCAGIISDLSSPCGIITNDFHCYRAKRLADGAGFKDAFMIPAPSYRPFLVSNVLRECMGVVKDFVFGHMKKPAAKRQ